jgi:hypothetical protein
MDIVAYKDNDGSVPFIDWLNDASRRDQRIAEKIRSALEILQEYGYRLRRPLADYLRDDIYELRIHFGKVNYRVFYGFYGDKIVIFQGCAKEATVPSKENDRAVSMMETYKTNPERHRHGI